MVWSIVMLACMPDVDSADAWSYPLDGVLRFDDLQAVGTHNSYHERTEGVEIEAWDYDHRPLDQQLGAVGVRQFEMDVTWDPASHDFRVFHVALVDENSSCDWLSDCLGVMRAWSDEHPAHHPIATLLELKDKYDEDEATPLLADLDAAVDASWPGGRRLSPDDVQRDAATLSAGLAEHGWPTLGELRGRAMWVLHTDSDFRQAYTAGDSTTEGRVLFPDAHGDLSLAVGAFSSINDPVVDGAAIAAALAAGHLVRTRTDSDGDEARANDTGPLAAALTSGAHFLSTDFPQPHPTTGYVVVMPDGTPSRCNPVTAPPECTSAAIEDPAFVGE
ncbi:MAG: hypothetical protein EXR71_14985 [Myxococcales bacterium]|nr:hypothetical protein [Myxococcales bacterium]